MAAWKKWLILPLWALLLLTLASAAGLVWVFLKGISETIPACFVYVFSFYTLTADCAACWLVLPGKIRAWKQRFNASKFGSRYRSDPDFRVRVSLTGSLAGNGLYVAINALSIALYHSYWFAVLTVYYGIMVLMRILLMDYARQHKLGTDMGGEWKRSRACAAIMLTVNLALSGAVLMILYQNKGKDYGNILIFAIAAYTFYSTIHAITSIIKYRKYRSPVMTTAKIVSLTSALVSMLNLETAMFAAFGQDMPPEDQRLMIILTGAGVSITIVTLSLYLIIRANKALKEARNNKELSNGE